MRNFARTLTLLLVVGAASPVFAGDAKPFADAKEINLLNLLQPPPAKAPFLQVREPTRRVHTDACIEMDTNRYSVPWRLIGETVTVVVSERQVRVLYAGHEVACHAQSALRRVSIIERAHLVGIVGAQFAGMSWLPGTPAPPPAIAPELLRPLEQYEAMLGGGW